MSLFTDLGSSWNGGRSTRALVIALSLVLVGPLARVAAQADAVRDLLTRGAYAEAERTARVELARSPDNSESLDAARAMARLAEAIVANGGAAGTEALTLSSRSLQIRRRQLAESDPEVGDGLDVSGLVHTARGDDAGAIPLEQVAVQTFEKSGDDTRLLAALEHLAVPLINLERFDDARSTLERALGITKRHAPGNSTDVAEVEELLATLYRARGDLTAAKQHADVAMAVRRDVTPDHPAIAALQHLYGDIAFLMGDPVTARSSYNDALNRAKRLGARHPLVSLYSRKLAAAELALGDSSTARQLREQALRIAEASLAPCHRDVLGAVNDLAASYLDDGDYSRARTMFARALDGHERCQGKNHSLTATALYNLAAVAKATGDWPEAERLLNRAIAIWSSTLGREHPFVIRARDSLAEVAEGRGLLRQALVRHQEVLAMRRRVLGPNHPDVARTLMRLAINAERLGQIALALRYADEAQSIYSATGATDAAPLASLLELRADIERAQGRRSAAARHLTEAREMRLQRFGAGHPSLAPISAWMAAIELESGDTSMAIADALQAEESGRHLLQFTIRELPERPALAFADTRAKGLDIALSATVMDSTRASLVYDSLVRSRGLVLDELAARAHADADASDAAVAALRHDMVAARQRYATLMLRAIQSAGAVPAERLDQARVEKEAAERAVAERSAEARAEIARSTSGLAEIRAAIPPRSALVSFVRYDRTRRPARADAPPRPVLPSYAAFVIRGASPTTATFVPLGSAANIDALVRAWRAAVLAGAGAVADAEARYRASAAPLRAAVWDPVARHLAGATRVFIVPDGLLNLVNFSSLPTATGRYLAESTQTLHYLATERDLLVDAPRPTGTSALVIGRPAFDSAPRRAAETRGGCLVAGEWHFGDLPGTGLEARDISRVWSRAGGEVTLLTGAAATKTAFRQALGGRRVVHLATHGFFLGDGCAPGATASRSVGGLVAAPQRVPASPGSSDNPLLLSGLAMAGANRRIAAQRDQDNGILTAEEIAGLDLQGTEWAVLSACDTGLGEIRSGEGVFGLRRAFQIAGARTVIMSLWSVDDEATRLWMRALYEGRLLRHLDTADAVKQASVTALKQRRAAHQSTHPFYWAAFVAAGDWR
jgi:CHAT domain-containing protein